MKPLMALKCEVYPNLFIVVFRRLSDSATREIRISGHTQSLIKPDIKKLRAWMCEYMTVGYNSWRYDVPLILFALQGQSVATLHSFGRSLRLSWNQHAAMNQFGVNYEQGMDHIDLSGVAPDPIKGRWSDSKVGLKVYAVRLHMPKLIGLPFNQSMNLSDLSVLDAVRECGNDVDAIIALYTRLAPSIAFRDGLSKLININIDPSTFRLNMLSMTDSQIAEFILIAKLKEADTEKAQQLGVKLEQARRVPIDAGARFGYKAPDFIKFKTPKLNALLSKIQELKFMIDDKGAVKLDDSGRGMQVEISDMVYRIGLGGLHSTEKSRRVVSGHDQVILDIDVQSYYPSLILNMEIKPENMGPSFLIIYREFVQHRIKYKAVLQDGAYELDPSDESKVQLWLKAFKLLINGLYGKLGSPYSIMYSPGDMIKITLTGQLCLLMLIESLADLDFRVISANTDGLMCLVDNHRRDIFSKITGEWEQNTKLVLESSVYDSVYSRDINNYIAIGQDISKTRGVFSPDSILKTPDAAVCAAAVVDYLKHGTPISETIRSCTDITQFVCARRVVEGCEYNGQYLGSIVRWIHVLNGDVIRSRPNGHRVAGTTGSRPVMTLSDESEGLPKDLDYNHYIAKANKLLQSLGVSDTAVIDFA